MVSRDHESERPAGSNAPREKKRGSQESQPRLGTRRHYLVERVRLQGPVQSRILYTYQRRLQADLRAKY